MLQYINYRIKFHVRLGYAIGKGFVVGEEEVLLQFDRIASVVHKNIAHRMRKRVDIARLDVIRSLGTCCVCFDMALLLRYRSLLFIFLMGACI